MNCTIYEWITLDLHLFAFMSAYIKNFASFCDFVWFCSTVIVAGYV